MAEAIVAGLVEGKKVGPRGILETMRGVTAPAVVQARRKEMTGVSFVSQPSRRSGRSARVAGRRP